MSSFLSDRLGSEILELVTDGGRKSFFVHKNLLTAQSALLRTKVEAVATERKLDLQSWDAETVVHFVNYIYRHTYDAVIPEPLSPGGGQSESTASDLTNTESRVHTPDTVRADSTVQPGASSDRAGPRPLTPIFELDDYSNSDDMDSNGYGMSAPEREKVYCLHYPLKSHDYRGTLLAHVRLYSLAQSLDVQALCKMAYNRLLPILGNFEPVAPSSRAVVDIVELLGYVYSNTHDTEDGMRKLVSQFAALNFTALGCTTEMKELVRQDSQLAVDIMGKVCRRLVASEDERDRYQEMTTSLKHVTEMEQENCRALKKRNASLEQTVAYLEKNLANPLL